MIEKIEIQPDVFEHIFKEIQIGIIIYHVGDLDDRESITIAGGNPEGSINIDLTKLTGTPMFEVFPNLVQTSLPEQFIDVVRTGEKLDLGEVTYSDENIPESIFRTKAFPLANNYLGVSYEDITKEKLAENALLKSNRELSAYSHVVSHDLKEPLNTINLLIEKLRNEIDVSNVAAMETMDMITVRTTRAASFISSILEFSEVGKITVPFENVDLKDCIKEVLENLESSISKKDALIQIQNIPPSVRGEKIKIILLFQNLIGNALKFQKEGNRPDIKIYMNDAEKSFELVVEDNGIGFSKDQALQIFNPFNQLNNKSRFEGSGIGLATCKRIIDHHEWKIRAESKEGKGSKFIITIPK